MGRTSAIRTAVWGSGNVGRDAGDRGDGAHIVDGRRRIAITVEATDENGNRAAGGNATAVGRLVNAIGWLHASAPGVYDALDVPLSPAVGTLTRKAPA